jgi:hypothetical protein
MVNPASKVHDSTKTGPKRLPPTPELRRAGDHLGPAAFFLRKNSRSLPKNGRKHLTIVGKAWYTDVLECPIARIKGTPILKTVYHEQRKSARGNVEIIVHAPGRLQTETPPLFV